MAVVIKTSKMWCPVCGGDVRWSCPSRTGYAYCEYSAKATRAVPVDKVGTMKFCKWQGRVMREKNGEVLLVFAIEDVEAKKG